MYESPINLFYTEPFIQALKDEQENYIMKAVQRMDVQVNKQELVKALAYDRAQYEKGFSDGIKESRWISVKERLPEEKVNVIIAVADMYYNMGDNTGVVIGWRYGDWYTYTAKGCEKINYPIAWMPIPEPPEAKEDT